MSTLLSQNSLGTYLHKYTQTPYQRYDEDEPLQKYQDRRRVIRATVGTRRILTPIHFTEFHVLFFICQLDRVRKMTLFVETVLQCWGSRTTVANSFSASPKVKLDVKGWWKTHELNDEWGSAKTLSDQIKAPYYQTEVEMRRPKTGEGRRPSLPFSKLVTVFSLSPFMGLLSALKEWE